MYVIFAVIYCKLLFRATAPERFQILYVCLAGTFAEATLERVGCGKSPMKSDIAALESLEWASRVSPPTFAIQWPYGKTSTRLCVQKENFVRQITRLMEVDRRMRRNLLRRRPECFGRIDNTMV